MPLRRSPRDELDERDIRRGALEDDVEIEEHDDPHSSPSGAGQKVFVQVADDMRDSKPNVLTLLAPDTSPQVAAMTYLITGADGIAPISYFGQVNAPALWLNRNAQGRFDPNSLETVDRISRNEVGTAAFFRTSQAYELALIAEKERIDQYITAPMTRPKAGMRWRLATVPEIIEYVKLPESGHSIGQIAGIAQVVDVRITEDLIRHHLISAGSTGSGKTNTNVHCLRAAQEADFCSLVYDAKPDYSEIDQPNDEPMKAGVAVGLKNVSFYALGTPPRRNETPISVRACDLDPGKLAAVIFFRPGEDLQSEVAEQLLMGFDDLQNKQPWTIWQFLNWLAAQQNAAAAANQMPFPTTFNDRTFAAVRQKFGRPGRIPNWVDALARPKGLGGPFGGAFSSGAGASDDEERVEGSVDTSWMARLKPREIHVIRVDAASAGRSYALFLDFAMKHISRLRKRNAIPPVMHLIDEAADIFVSPNRRLRDMMTGTLDEEIRKGRSLSIGFVISAQSAGDIPEQIRHNLNSSIIFRHKHPKVLREVLPDASEGVVAATSRLQPGEAIVQLFKTFGLLRCRMWQSPAKLYKPAATGSQPTAPAASVSPRKGGKP